MKKRFIGLDIGSNCSYLTLLEYERNELKTIRFFSSHVDKLADQLAELSENIGNSLSIGDRLAAALPAKTAYIRKLELPFKDPKKIAAAVPFSLSSQIPVPADDCLTSMIIHPRTADGVSRVTAAAIPKQTIKKILDASDLAGLSLHILDLPPFSLLPLVSESIQNAILIAVNSQETIISHIQSGELRDYQLLPKKIAANEKVDIQSMTRAVQNLMAKSKETELPILVIGDGDTEPLADKLADAGFKTKELVLSLAGETIPPAFVHATSLAYRAAETGSWKSFNFRRGEYALKGEWQKLKRALWLAASLTIISSLILATTAVIQYQTRATQVNKLDAEMARLFRQTFPTTSIVNVPLQMKSRIRELREQMMTMGLSQPKVLSILKVLSESTSNIPVEVEELSAGAGEIKVNGNAASFDAINKISELLQRSPLIDSAQVADTQMALKGDKINFRLILSLASN